METEKFTSRIKKYFIPSYDELTLFLIGYTFFLLLLINNEFREALVHMGFERFDPRAIMLLCLILPGAILSIVHIFTKRKKTKREKSLMVLFVFIINFIVALYAFVYAAIETQERLFLVFPFWNFLSAILVIYLMRAGVIKEDIIEDDNAPLHLVIIGILLMTLILGLCQYMLEFHWAITFSLSVAYVITINKLINNMITKQR